MPAAKRPRVGPVEAATKRDLAKLSGDLADSAYAASALALARELDSPTSATSKSMCAARHMEILDRLRELAPPEEKRDGLDEISARRAVRLAARGSAAGSD